MKKIIISFFLIIISVTAFSYSYSVKCKVCQSEYNKSHGCTTPNQAWRDFGTPIKHIDGKAYATYKCASGHKFLVEL